MGDFPHYAIPDLADPRILEYQRMMRNDQYRMAQTMIAQHGAVADYRIPHNIVHHERVDPRMIQHQDRTSVDHNNPHRIEHGGAGLHHQTTHQEQQKGVTENTNRLGADISETDRVIVLETDGDGRLLSASGGGLASETEEVLVAGDLASDTEVDYKMEEERIEQAETMLEQTETADIVLQPTEESKPDLAISEFDIDTTWRSFLEFENQVFIQELQTFSEFLELWLSRLKSATDSGLTYPDNILALKLLKQAGLDDESQKCVLAVLQTYMLIPDKNLLQETTELLKTLSGEKGETEVEKVKGDVKVESDGLSEDEDQEMDGYSSDEKPRTKKIFVGEKEEVGSCNKCLKTFTSLPTFKKHLRSCPKSLKCDFCDEVFPDLHALRKHKKSHSFKCEFCFKECINKNQLNTHRTRVHAEKLFKCDKCESSFPTANWLKAHAKVHKKEILTYKCDQCGKDFVGKDNFKQHRRTHEKYKCDPCYKFFKTQERLDEHIGNHKFFRCEECNISFTQNHKFQKHMQTARHGLERSFQCDKCEKSFVKNCGLQEHMRKHDEEERKFKCSVCEKKFFTKDRLNVHNRIHTGEKPYECEICLKRFTQSGDRNKHRRTHGEQHQQHSYTFSL